MEHLESNRRFDIPEVRDFIPRRLKPWLFIIYVVIIQFSGGVYLAAATDMIGTTAMMQEDVLMAGYASLVGMSLNFAVMFRIKFRFSTYTQLLVSCGVLILANIIGATTDSVPLLVFVCFVGGWFRMQATLACNSTIQLWLTPVRDMSIFFCYVYLVVDGVIQLSGIATVYSAFHFQWETMQWIMTGLLGIMMLLVLITLRPLRPYMYLPLVGIDWLGSLLWGVFMLCFTFVCVYGNYFDWWSSSEILFASCLGLICCGINLWRATFLRHPYISYAAIRNRNVVKAVLVYVVFFTLLATEHVFEHSYASTILGFDETNLIDLNWYVLMGIVLGVGFTYYGFALRKWGYASMTAVAFGLACGYLAYFYFLIDYGVEKEMLAFPLMMRGAASVIVSIVYLTSVVQSGLSFQVFPQALVINGFGGAVVGATLGPALIGEMLRRVFSSNLAFLVSQADRANWSIADIPVAGLYGRAVEQALVVSMKEIYGWLLVCGLTAYVLVVAHFINNQNWENIKGRVKNVKGIRIFEKI